MKIKATCPNCEKTFTANNNDEVCCPFCDCEFVTCDENAVTMWN
jgi:hypothetical protein